MMKNKVLFIVFVTLFSALCFAENTFADVGGPGVGYIDVRVNNADGALITGSTVDGTKNVRVAVDTVLHVYDRDTRGEGYNILSADCEKLFDKNTYSCYVESADVVKTGTVNLSSYKKDYKKDFVSFKSGVLYDIPSMSMKNKIDGSEFEAGIEFSSYYYDDLFAYVEYGDKKGWLFYGYLGLYKNDPISVGIVIDDSMYFTANQYTITDVAVFSDPEDQAVEIGHIPAGQTLATKFMYYLSPYSFAYYVEYNDIQGWIRSNYNSANSDWGYIANVYQNKKQICSGEIILYSDHDGGTAVTTVPKYAVVDVHYLFETQWYEYGGYAYLTYNGVSGWVRIEPRSADGDLFELYDLSDHSKTTFESDMPVYDMYDGKLNGLIISAGVTVSCPFARNGWEYCMQANTENEIGWVYTGTEDTKNDVNILAEFWKKMDDIFKMQGEIQDVKLEEDEQISLGTIIIICAVTALSVGLLIFFMIKIGRKNHPNEVKELSGVEKELSEAWKEGTKEDSKEEEKEGEIKEKTEE